MWSGQQGHKGGTPNPLDSAVGYQGRKKGPAEVLNGEEVSQAQGRGEGWERAQEKEQEGLKLKRLPM